MATEARIVISAHDQTKAAFASVNSGLKNMQGLAASVGLSLGAIGAGLSVGAAIAALKGAIDALDNLKDAADATGASVESLSKIERIARLNGQSLDVATSAVIRLNKSLNDAKPGDQFSTGLERIGTSVAELKRLDPAEAFIALSKALDTVADDGNKARFVLDATGKSVREIAPLMKDIADAGDINATVTARQAEEAEAFNKQLFLLKTNVGDAARAIVSDAVPAINALIDRFRKASGESLSFLGTLRNAMSFRPDSAAGIRAEIASIDKEIKSVAERSANPYNPFSDFVDPFGMTTSRLGDRKAALLGTLREIEEAQKKAAAAAEQDTKQKPSIGDYRPPGPPGPKGPKGPKPLAEKGEYDKLNESIRKRIALQQAEAASTEDLTQGERLAVEVMAQLRDGTLKLVAAKGMSVEQQKQSIASSLEELITLDKAAMARERNAALIEKSRQAGEKMVSDLAEQVDAQREQNELYGKTEQQQTDLAAIKLDLAAATDEEVAANMRAAVANEDLASTLGDLRDAYEKYATDLEAAAAKRRELAQLMREGAAAKAEKEAIDRQRDEWTRLANDIEAALTDKIVRAFDAGENAGKVFIESIRDYFKTAVIRVGVQAVVNTITGAVTGQAGSGAETAQTGGGSSLNLISGAANLVAKGLGFGGGLAGAGQAFVAGAGLTSAEAAAAAGAYQAAGYGGTALAIEAGSSLLGGTAFGTGLGLTTAEAATAAAVYNAAGYTGTAISLQAGSAVGSAVSTLAAAAPYIAAVIAIASLFMGEGGGPKTEGIFDTSGITNRGSRKADPVARTFVDSLSSTYEDMAKKLGGTADKAMRMAFSFALDPQGTARNRLTLTVGDTTGTRRTGRPDDFNDQLVEYLNRGLLAALKETDLYDSIDAMLDAFDPFTASTEEVATEMKKLAAEMEAITSASKAYLEAIDQISSVMAESQNMFADSIRSIQMQSMTSQEQYAFLDKEAARYLDVIRSLTDPTLIKEYASKLNQTITSAFSLLDDEEKKRLTGEYVSLLTEASTVTTDRLQAAADIQREAFAGLPESIRTSIEEAMSKAVAAIREAVQRGVHVDIRVPAGYEVGVT